MAILPDPMIVDALDATKPDNMTMTITVNVRYRNSWRARLGFWLVELARRALRARIDVIFVEDVWPDGPA